MKPGMSPEKTTAPLPPAGPSAAHGESCGTAGSSSLFCGPNIFLGEILEDLPWAASDMHGC